MLTNVVLIETFLLCILFSLSFLGLLSLLNSLPLTSLQLASLYLPFSANLLMYIVFLCNLSYM